MDVNIQIFTSKEVQQLLRISKQTLHRWSNAGKLGTRVGRRWKYRADEIEGLLKAKSE